MKKKSFPLSRVYTLLEPGPVVMLTTISSRGIPNIMTMSWHMMVDFSPPLLACVVSNRNFSFENLKKTKECVINIPTHELAKAVVGVGNTTGPAIDKFKKFNLTKEPAACVRTPLIGECFANLECTVADMKMVTKYNIFVLEVIKAWISTSSRRPKTIHHQGGGVFSVDGEIIKLPSRKK